jgi:spoIIIJ-associated protein
MPGPREVLETVEWVEITARTVEEAKEEALDHLGVAEEDAEFEILAEPRAGILGLGRSDARVRARVRPATPRPKAESRRRRRPARPSSRGSHGSGASGGRRREDRSAQRNARSASGRGRERAGRRAAAEEVSEAPAGRGSVMEESVPLGDQGEIARRFLEGVTERLEVPGEISQEELDDETVELRITGEGLGLLIGPKGSTLAALQELTRTVVQRKAGRRAARLVLDVGGYRKKRKEALQRFARQVAEDVLATGEEESLEPMSPPDRKVVHDTVNEIAGVSTRSEGDEPRRRVVVVPE